MTPQGQKSPLRIVMPGESLRFPEATTDQLLALFLFLVVVGARRDHQICDLRAAGLTPNGRGISRGSLSYTSLETGPEGFTKNFHDRSGKDKGLLILTFFTFSAAG